MNTMDETEYKIIVCGVLLIGAVLAAAGLGVRG